MQVKHCFGRGLNKSFSRPNGIKNESDRIIWDETGMRECWRKYFRELSENSQHEMNAINNALEKMMKMKS